MPASTSTKIVAGGVGAPAALAALVAFIAIGACASVARAQVQLPGMAPPRRGTDIQIPKMRERDRAPASPSRSNSVDDRPTLLSIGAQGEVGVVDPAAPPPAAGDVLALLADSSAPAKPEFPGLLVLADGQRLRGELDVRTGTPVWRTVWLAPRTVGTDGVRSISFDDSPAPTATDADVVHLKNGDTVVGIVTALDARGLEVEQGAGAEKSAVRLPFETVRSVAFVAPPQPSAGARIWLSDGNVIDAPDAQWLSADYLRAPGIPGLQPGQPASFPRNALLGLRSSAASVTALASLVPQVSEAEDGVGLRYSLVPPQPRPGEWSLDAPPLEVEGPVLLNYPALTQPSRLIATVTRPAGARQAGTTVLVVRAAGTELARQKFGPGHSRAELRVDLPAGPFELELLAADGSAAGDLLVLERAIIVPRNETPAK